MVAGRVSRPGYGDGEPMDALTCLALVVYMETRSEPEPAQFAVAEVTMRRVEDDRWPDDVCGVVFEKRQYAWNHKPVVIREPDAWALARDIAGIVMRKGTRATSCADHFAQGSPSWSHGMDLENTIGLHHFWCSDESDWRKR